MLRFVVWLVPLALLAALICVVVTALQAEPARSDKTPVVTGGAFPRTIHEASGRTVTIPKQPVRIVAADAGGADVLSELVEPGRIAGVPALIGDFAGALEFFKSHPEIPRFNKFDAEALLAIRPDLVLASSIHNPNTISILAEAGIPVMRYDSFRSFAGIRAWILAVGRAVGEEENARRVIERFDRRLAGVESALKARPKPRVLAYSNYGHGFAIGSGESQDEIVRRAGGANAACEMNLTGHVNFTFEQMLKLNPDALVVTGNDGLESPQVKVLLNEPALSGLAAIKQRRIAVVPDRFFNSTSQHVADAVESLARQLHREAFEPTKEGRP